MLEYLVTSRARRALLEVLCVDGSRGTAAELARLAGLNFAGAYRELKQMLRYDLVRAEAHDGREVYSANADHPVADALRALVAFRPQRYPRGTELDDAVRAALAEQGVPVQSLSTPKFDGSREELIARGARLARRDPSLAR